MNPLQQLHALGQSVWYDNIRRALLTGGELARYRDEYAVTGVTANPTILERAIAGSTDYDDALRGVSPDTVDAEALFWDLAVEDLRATADVLRGVYDSTDGADGYASLELAPAVAHDAQASIAAGREASARLDRPNVMVKVPGTTEGVKAIEELTYEGINVNVTLLFSPGQWEPVAEAYLRGLERRLDEGADLDVASVASFFISRIDKLANPELPDDLRNQLGVANAEVVHAAYHRMVDSARWQRLAGAGARPQRLLWASTATKDPDLPDTFYVSRLAAPDTIDTMPHGTLMAFADHGEVGEPMTADDTEGRRVVDRAKAAGVDVEDVAARLQDDGLAKFGDSFDRVVTCVHSKVAYLAEEQRREHWVEPIRNQREVVLDDLAEREAPARVWKRDHTLWQDDPEEVSNRLGWLDVAEEMEERLDELEAFAEKAAAEGMTDAVVLGMGGASLFPLTLAEAAQGSRLRLHVIDTIDPQALERLERAIPLDTSLVVAASKSGGTTETRDLLAWLWDRIGDPNRFAVITDPGTSLADLARERGFRGVFENPPDIGGRYSAMSYFGLVPGVLAGADVKEMLARAGRMAAACADCVDVQANPAVQLAATIAGAARAGRDKLTLVLPEGAGTFGLWIEQLVAESTGKRGTGVLPVVGEPLGPPEVYGDDRVFVAYGDHDGLQALTDAGHPLVRLPLDEPADLGSEVFRWEMATALVGAALGINPFDQPDVEAAKQATGELLERGVSEETPTPLAELLGDLEPGSYLAIQAYVDPGSKTAVELERARAALRDRYGVAVTLGIGPRYLHSTGQLHKGGPPTGVFAQVVADDADDPPVPGRAYGFSTLKRAQAAGDLAALRDRGRRAARIDLDELLALGR